MQLVKIITLTSVLFIAQFSNVSAKASSEISRLTTKVTESPKFDWRYKGYYNVLAQSSRGFTEVEKLYNDNKFTAVLNAIDAVISQSNNGETLTKLYHMRGSSRFNAIYQARTGVIFGSDKTFDETRPRFELEYNEKFIKLLNGASRDLKQAMEIGSAYQSENKDNSGFANRFKDTEFNIRKVEALIYLEKAQVVTNTAADFLAVENAFLVLEPLYTPYLGNTSFDEMDNALIRLKGVNMLAAEIRTKVALGDINTANFLFDKLMKAKGTSRRNEIIIPAMVEAFDLVGNYKHTEGFLLREAVRQITIDRGKIVPANLAIHKAAMKSHLYNLNYAAQIPPTGKFWLFIP